MGFWESFLPPPGAPGAVRAGAGTWRETARQIQALGDGAQLRGAALTSGWWGPAKEGFVAETWRFFRALDEGAGLMREYAHALDSLADGIDHAQAEYHQRMAAVAATAAVGVALTAVTLTASDEVAAAAVTTELAAATELAATAATQMVAALTSLAGQAAALAGRVAVLAGVNVTTDAVSGMVVHRDLDPLAHLHLADDLEWALVGGVSVPLAGGVLGGLSRWGGGGLLQGGRGVATRLAVTGLSVGEADAVVRLALGQQVDAAEVAMAAAPLGGAGRRSQMIGADGVRVVSKVLGKGKGWRIDLENPDPGGRSGQIHLHDYRGNKWLYDFDEKRFIGLPRSLEKAIMTDRHALQAVKRGLEHLGEIE
ncbi:MAG TPA: hypothetical protein VEV65_14470 [Kineosporiaceae bacterium]|nr:hypothetical protein [Kineosporiaceae bacterium]